MTYKLENTTLLDWKIMSMHQPNDKMSSYTKVIYV